MQGIPEGPRPDLYNAVSTSNPEIVAEGRPLNAAEIGVAVLMLDYLGNSQAADQHTLNDVKEHAGRNLTIRSTETLSGAGVRKVLKTMIEVGVVCEQPKDLKRVPTPPTMIAINPILLPYDQHREAAIQVVTSDGRIFPSRRGRGA